jgi:hypothetical protein
MAETEQQGAKFAMQADCKDLPCKPLTLFHPAFLEEMCPWYLKCLQGGFPQQPKLKNHSYTLYFFFFLTQGLTLAS